MLHPHLRLSPRSVPCQIPPASPFLRRKSPWTSLRQWKISSPISHQPRCRSRQGQAHRGLAALRSSCSKEENYRPAPARALAVKSHYQANELDGTPRLLRHGSASFPSSLARQGVTRGTVTFEVELSTSGSVSIRRVASSTHPELVAAARRVASGARFTPPKKNGQPVKAIMRWPIVIEK